MSDVQPTKEQPQAKRKVEITYRVKRAFKYMNEMLQPGEEFVPMGQPFDAKLINQGKFVQRIEAAEIDAEEARRHRGKTAPKGKGKGGDDGK